MRLAVLTAFALGLTAAGALAQTSPGSGSSGTTSSSGSVGRGAPALTPKASGPATPNRSNTDVFPPSRLLPPAQGSVSTQQQTQTPGSTSTGTPSASSTASTGQTTTPGGTPTTPDASTSATQNSANATATTTGGQSGASGSSSQTKPIPPNSQTSSGSTQTQPTRTGKNALNETIADCMKLWEPATHMSRADWQRTCRRVQGRLDQVTKQVLGNSGQ